jgi:hypothetical protein
MATTKNQNSQHPQQNNPKRGMGSMDEKKQQRDTANKSGKTHESSDKSHRQH